MKLSGLVPMQALGMASRSHKLVKEAEEMCPKCGKPMAQCECMGEDMDKNVANGLPQTQGDDKIQLSREHFKNIVREVMKEESEYQRIFQKMLSKFGVNSPADLSDEQKKKFFTLVKGIQTELKERIIKIASSIQEIDKAESEDNIEEVEGKKPMALDKYVVTATPKGAAKNADRRTITQPAPKNSAQSQLKSLTKMDKYQSVRLKKA